MITARFFAARLLATILALFLVWIIVLGVWRILAPGPDAANASAGIAASQTAARTVIAADLFRANVSPARIAEASTGLDIRLKGVYAPRFAIISTGSGPDRGVVVGGEVQAGVKLHAVFPDHVLVANDRGLERVNLDSRRSGPAQSVARPAPRANSVPLSRSELAPMLIDPRQLIGLGQLGSYPTAGIVINDASSGSLAAKMGLRQGDVVQKIADRPVTGKEDLLRIAELAAANSEIAVELLRNNAPLRVVFTVQP